MSVNSRILILLAITGLCLGHSYAKAGSIQFQSRSDITTVIHPLTVATIAVCLDPGYCINIKDANDIEVYQSTIHGGNPFTTYYGCGQVNVLTTFPAIIRATAEAASIAQGDWSVTLDGQTVLPISIGTTSIAICVLGVQVYAHLLVSTEAQENVSVARVTLQVMPQ